MFRQDPSPRTSSKGNLPDRANMLTPSRALDFNLQQELDQLEEMILESFHIPLTRRTIVDEDSLLNQLDIVRMNLPEAFEKALELLQQKQEILAQAEEYAQKIILSAQQRAAQIADETRIVQQAQAEAHQIRQQVQQECEVMQRQTLDEIEQMRYSAQQELQQMLQRTQAECADIQHGADEYAERVLGNIEQQLADMLKVIHNGRQQLSHNSNSRNSQGKRLPG